MEGLGRETGGSPRVGIAGAGFKAGPPPGRGDQASFILFGKERATTPPKHWESTSPKAFSSMREGLQLSRSD